MSRKLEHLGLPPEIINEILSNLPVKPLARFRCVSKFWNSLISDSSFQEEHYRRCLQKDPVLLISTIDQDIHPNILDLSIYDANDLTGITNFTIPFPVPPSSSFCGSIQICRGLACVALYTDIFVCNPATREIISLPLGEETSNCVGFGYASSTNQFKVVRFFRNPFSSRTKNCCEIFTLGTSEWRETRFPPPSSSSKSNFHAPFLHGAIHFLSDPEDLSADFAIYALDIESEQYTKIPLPKDYYVAGESVLPVDWKWQCLNEFRGSLYLTSNFETSIQLWFLKDYNSGKWVKDCVIDLPPQICSEFIWAQPLVIIGDGRILLKFILDIANELWLYNPGDKTFQEYAMENYAATMYVESLLPLAF